MQPMKMQKFARRANEVATAMGSKNKNFPLAACVVVAHESKGGTYWEQQGGGPALGIIQMEDWVHDDVWQNCDNIHKYAKRLNITQNLQSLKSDLDYNIFMMRCRFIMDVNPFPSSLYEMAVYIKRYWNSDMGAASPEKYISDFGWWALHDVA